MLVQFENSFDMQGFVDELSEEEANFHAAWEDLQIEVDKDDIQHLADTTPLGVWIQQNFKREVEDYDG